MEAYRETKIGTEVAHVTRDSDTTFKVNRSKVNLRGRRHIVAASRTAWLYRHQRRAYPGPGCCSGMPALRINSLSPSLPLNVLTTATADTVFQLGLCFYAPAPNRRGIKRWCASDVWRLSVCLAYPGPKSRTERHRKTKIGTEVAHVTRDSETTFKVKRSKVNLQGAGAYCGGLPHSLL